MLARICILGIHFQIGKLALLTTLNLLSTSGGVHSGRGAAEAGGDVPVLAPLPQPQEADRGQVLPPQQEHDHAETHQTLQVRGVGVGIHTG